MNTAPPVDPGSPAANSSPVSPSASALDTRRVTGAPAPALSPPPTRRSSDRPAVDTASPRIPPSPTRRFAPPPTRKKGMPSRRAATSRDEREDSVDGWTQASAGPPIRKVVWSDMGSA